MPWLALGMLGIFATLWFLLPRVRALQRLVIRGMDPSSSLEAPGPIDSAA
ncbi:MAG TPA: hypothetical protein VGR67_12255 [Candidatus Polarisedimenticolia bacterium]|jgi:hypothetical protein|nr:hypothetical protein [Candidatus Polarisedimenticolia bacterium]